MVAALDFNTKGIARFAYRGIHNPWHREGVVLPEDATIEVAAKVSGMDYIIEEHPIFSKIGGKWIPIPSHKLIRRDTDGKHLSVMGKDYQPVQVKEAFGMLDSLVESAELKIETLGVLNEGKRAFVCTSIAGDPLEIVPGDLMNKYLLLADSYDGSMALTMAFVGVLVVCQNTLNAALSDSGSVKSKSKHTRNVLGKDRIDEVRKALGLANSSLQRLAAFGKKLAHIKMKKSEVDDFHKALILGDKKGSSVEDWTGQQRRALGELDYLYHNGPGQELEGREGTAWGAHNSVSAWVSHMKNYKATTTRDRTHFTVFGPGNAITAHATQLLVNQYQVAA